MELLLLYLFSSLGISFLCSILEGALLSTPISYVSLLEEQKNKYASLIRELKQDIDRPISAILTLNTIAHTVGAAGVGTQAVKLFGEQYFGLVSAILTLLILILSEIIPKTLSAIYWKKLIVFTAKTCKIIIYITLPVVWFSKKITKLFTSGVQEASVSREEVSAMLSTGVEEGTFEIKESKIIQNLIRLENVKTKVAMTPRIVVAMAPENMSLKEFYENKSYLHHSRIPIYNEDKENITGYVLRQKVFELLADDQFHFKLRDIKRDIISFSEHMNISKVWESMLNQKEQIALIIDEYGGFEGIITMEDIIETFLGLEILDEKDKIEDMQLYAKERWNERKEKYRHL